MLLKGTVIVKNSSYRKYRTTKIEVPSVLVQENVMRR